MENSPAIQSRPYTRGYDEGHWEGSAAENPFILGTKSFSEYEQGKKEGNRAWYVEKWSQNETP